MVEVPIDTKAVVFNANHHFGQAQTLNVMWPNGLIPNVYCLHYDTVFTDPDAGDAAGLSAAQTKLSRQRGTMVSNGERSVRPIFACIEEPTLDN